MSSFERYSVRHEPDGRCSIIDAFTGQPPFYFGRWLRGMPEQIACAAVITMNLIDQETNSAAENTSRRLN